MEEVWKDIPGYEGLYQVSNHGNVRSLNWRNLGYTRNLYLKEHNRGYRHVELIKNGKRKAFTVHRLVAMVFIPNPNNYPVINHRDEDKTNNVVENLEWCTKSYNAKYSSDRHSYAYKRGRRKNPHRAWKYGGRKIVQLTLDDIFVKEWSDIIAIKRTNFSNSWSITQCCHGNRKTAYGFKWRFADEYSR